MIRQKNTITIDGNKIEYWKIDYDCNGNPRYVIHFLVLDTDYEKAVRKIKSIGGRKYTAKWYGGGLVFSSYNLEADLRHAMK